MSPHVLLADDDPFGRRYVELILKDVGMTYTGVGDGEAALQAFRDEPGLFDILITDVRMPKLSGIDLIRRIREQDPSLPIIAVSVMSADEQIVAGLEAGADDYITKPISGPVLIAKVRAGLRRASGTGQGSAGGILEVEDLRLDPATQVLTKRGTPVPLTRTELNLVEYLMRNAGRIASPAQILGAVWGEAYEEESEILRVAVRRVRRKLEDDPSTPHYLRNHPGLGYSIGMPASGA